MPEGKKRHGCLLAYLIFLLVANSAAILMYLFFGGFIRDNQPGLPIWALPVLIVFGIVNLICAIALFKWKKWGFWGYCISAAIVFIINIAIGLGVGQSVMGLVGVAILFGVLQIGRENKGWPQLD